jgi:hypothetical protein
MTKSEITILIDSLLPRLYGYAYALVGSDLHAEQLIIDAYTVYIVNDKEFLSSANYDFQDKHERSEIKKYLLKEMMASVYELAMKRAPQVLGHAKEYLEHDKFFEIDIQKRAALYLKEVAGYPVEDLQEIFALQRPKY